MNVVLESLFLRRPRIEYISPPVCPVHFSASGTAIFEQCFNDLQFCSANKINTNFLNFQEPADGLAYNIYYSTQETGQPFQLVNDGLPPGTAVVFTAGLYWFTANTASGTESMPFPGSVAPGGQYVRMVIPKIADAVSWNLYKDGVKLITAFTGAIVESSAQGWYQATKITTDGETPLSGCSALLLSGTVPVPPPPPPPPPPGPAWTTFNFGGNLCLGCLGNGGTASSSGTGGGFFPPGTFFSVFVFIVGGSFDTLENTNGFVQGFYTGPLAHCRLQLTAAPVGSGFATVNNRIEITVNGADVLLLSGPQCVSGNYDFFVPASTNALIRFNLQQCATANQNINWTGQIINIP